MTHEGGRAHGQQPAGPAPVSAATSIALRSVTALISGLLLLLAFPPYGLWPAAPLGVATLLWAVRGVGMGRGALLGLVTGLAFFVPLLHWSGIYVGPVPWLLLASSQAAFFAALGFALAGLRRGWSAPAAVALGTAGLWVAQEALRTRIPYGGFPWGRLAFSSVDAPWIEIASLGGAPAVTFVIALAGALVALAGEALVRSRRTVRPWLLATLAVLVAGAPALLGAVNRGLDRRDTGTAVVAVIQGDVPRAGLDFNAQRQAVLNNHLRRTAELAEQIRSGAVPAPDLVVWPENSSDIDPFADPAVGALIDAAVDDVGAPVLVGAILRGPGPYISNAGILWLPGKGAGERYVKRHPVPFAEYIPLRGLARQVSSAVDRVRRDQVAGDSVGIFSVEAGTGDMLTFGDVICFEVGYDRYPRDAVRAGATLLAVQTNNATFGYTPQTEQQLVMSRLRAIEHDRATVVAATSGVSAVIAPGGRILRRTELFEPAVVVERVELRTSTTPATVLGAFPEGGLAMVGVGFLFAGFLLPRLTARRKGHLRT